jgi:hypothetical protein
MRIPPVRIAVGLYGAKSRAEAGIESPTIGGRARHRLTSFITTVIKYAIDFLTTVIK